jgi:hypothetical protein
MELKGFFALVNAGRCPVKKRLILVFYKNTD